MENVPLVAVAVVVVVVLVAAVAAETALCGAVAVSALIIVYRPANCILVTFTGGLNRHITHTQGVDKGGRQTTQAARWPRGAREHFRSKTHALPRRSPVLLCTPFDLLALLGGEKHST